jgi:hypothetical protein
LPGEKNGIFIVDIDDTEEWKELLKNTQNEDPDTVRAFSGNGGIHLYFKYNKKLQSITSKDKAIEYNGKKLSIDIKSNGGFIIVPPSYYHNDNFNKKVTYKWEKNRSIFEHDLMELPEWLENLFLEKQNGNKIVKKNNKNIDYTMSEDIDNNSVLDIEDCKKILKALNKKRCCNYTDWIQIGQILKFYSTQNVNLLNQWINWSKKSDKFKDGECEKVWKTFKKSNK